MSLFEFIVGMISVLIALTVAQLLVGLGRLVQAPGRVRLYLPHSLWNGALFLLLYLHWWSLWDFRALEWNSAMFFFSLMGPTFAFFASTLLTPLPAGDAPVDLRAHFDRIRPLFLAVLAGGMVFMIADGPLLGTEAWLNPLRGVQAVMVSATLAGLFSARPGLQILVAAINLLALLGIGAVRFLPGTFA